MTMKMLSTPGRSGASLLALAALMLAHGAQAAAAPAAAPAPAPAPAEDAKPTGEESPVLVVTGRRMTDASQAIGEDQVTNTVAITRKALLSAPAGVSGLKMLEQLPGFNVQTDGALGLYEFGNSVQTRAYNLDQIGFVVDGIPTGRSDAFGGSPVFRYVDNENLGSVVASVGAGDVSIPSYSSLGPVVSYNSVAPQHKPGLFVSEALGQFNLRRNFIRASTGDLGPISAYVSRTKLSSDLWRGAGGIRREHWEGQVHANLGGDSWARLKFVSNDFHDNDSPTLTRAQYNSPIAGVGNRAGRYLGYINPPANTTPGYTPTTAGVPYSNVNYANNTASLAINVRNDRLYGATVHLGIAQGVYLESTGYLEHKSGYGVSADSYDNSLLIYTREKAAGLDVVAPKGTQYGRSGVGGDRYGLTETLHWQAGAHKIDLGVWGEYEKYHRTQARYNTTDGSPTSDPDFSKPVFLRRDYIAHRNTTQVFLKDNVTLGKFEITAGIKGLILDYNQRGYRDYADYYRYVGGVAIAGYGPQSNKAHYSDLFLPLVGAVYKLDNHTQFFASYAENMAMPKGIDDIYSVTLASSSAVVPAPAAERSQNAEFGVRTRQHDFFASLATYYTKYKNRIQSINSPLPGSNTLETFYTNVGRVEAYGAEFSGNYKPSYLHGFAYFNLNATYNHARSLDNVMSGTTVLYATAGKQLPDNAAWIINGGVTVEPTTWMVANLSAKYTSGRWSTLDNTKGSNVPAFTVLNAYVDIGDGWHVGPLKTVKARFNIDNLLDKDTLAFISTAATGDGYFRPLSPRTYQFSLSAEY
jgi:iron complex outermembrane receptor protein